MTTEDRILERLRGGPLSIRDLRGSAELNAAANLTRKGKARFFRGRYTLVPQVVVGFMARGVRGWR